MPWTADVPFPAEDLSKCRGCGATIGWVRHYDEATGRDKPHPVDPRGWAGIPCGPNTLGAVRGYTRGGDKSAVTAPPVGTLFATRDLDVVFPSHFGTCPKRDRFYANARNRDRVS